jgi:hypothetical protein
MKTETNNPKKMSLRQIIERDKIFKSPAMQEKCVRAGEHLERMAVIALKRVCVQLGVKYWL